MSSSPVAEPSNSVHPVVRIVECARWHERAGVDQDHRPSSARKISSVRFAKLGSLLMKLPTRASHAAIRFLLRFSSCALRCFPGFALGIALFLSAADGHWPHLYCVGSGMPIGESLLNVWFRRCSSVVGSSSVSEFA